MKKLFRVFIFIGIFIHPSLSESQWSTPVLIDSTRQVVWPLIAVSSTRQIAALSFNTVYISEDLGKTFERRYTFIPSVTYWHMFYPGGIVYDSNGSLWILWSWDECSDDECTFSIDYWIYLSKSIDSGRTFQHMIRQKRGLACVGNTPSNPLLAIGKDNTVHFLYDSLPRFGETYKIGNDLTYCKLPNGDTTKRVDQRLPELPDSMDYLGAFFSVSPSGRVHVTLGGSPSILRSYILYTHSLPDSAFLPYVLFDTINPPRQGVSNHIFKAGELFMPYLVSNDPFDTTSANHVFVRESIDDGDSFKDPVEIFVAPFSIRGADSMYFHCVRYSSIEGGLKYFKYVDLLQPPIDSAYIGKYFDLQLVLDDSGCNYIVMNDDSSNAYFSKKDGPTSVKDDHPTLPSNVELRTFPNPFNGTTTIYFILPYSTHIELTLYDLLGRKVRTLLEDTFPNGEHRYVLEGNDLAGGVYPIKLNFGSCVVVTKLLLIK